MCSKNTKKNEILQDWLDSREEALEKSNSLLRILSKIRSIYRKKHPTFGDLNILKESLDMLELPLVDHYGEIFDNDFVNKWIYPEGGA